jgi:biopolymer transport protein ExbD
VVDKKPDDTKIKKRNIFVVLINSNNQLMVQGEQMDVRLLKDKAKEFIKNEYNNPDLPEKKAIEVDFFGTVETTTEHVISLQNDRGTKYQAYIEVQNELVKAYNELRNEISKEKFGAYFSELDEEKQSAVQKIYPQKISEAEPKNYGGVN